MRTLHFDPSPSMLEHSSRKEPLSESVDVDVENERAASNQDACDKPGAVSGERCIGPSGISCATRSCYCSKFPRFPQLPERASLSKSVFEERASIAEAGIAPLSSGSASGDAKVAFPDVWPGMRWPSLQLEQEIWHGCGVAPKASAPELRVAARAVAVPTACDHVVPLLCALAQDCFGHIGWLVQ